MRDEGDIGVKEVKAVRIGAVSTAMQLQRTQFGTFF